MSDDELAKIKRWYTDHPDDGVVAVYTELLALRQRVAELEAVAARRLELLRPFATAYDAWVAADSDTAIEITPDQASAAAAEVVAKGGDRG